MQNIHIALYLASLPPQEKQAGAFVGKLIGNGAKALFDGGALLHKGMRFGAGVPNGQAFAPTIGKGVSRVAKLTFNPNVKGWWNAPKRVAQGAGLFGIGTGIANGRDAVRSVAQETNNLLPEHDNLKGVKDYLGAMTQSPVLTAVNTMWNGLPPSIPPGQRELVGTAANIAARNSLSNWWRNLGNAAPEVAPHLADSVHTFDQNTQAGKYNNMGTDSPTAGVLDILRNLYTPLARPALRGVKQVLPDIEPAPMDAYGKLLRSIMKARNEWGQQSQATLPGNPIATTLPSL